MAELIECPECHTERAADTDACPNCTQETAAAQKRAIFQPTPEKIILVLAVGWAVVQLFSTVFGKYVHTQHYDIDYAAVSAHMGDRITNALPIYEDLRRKADTVFQHPSPVSGKLTKAMTDWADEEQHYQHLVLWKGAPRQVLSHAPAAVATQLKMHLEAITDLDIADNVLYQAWTILTESCNGSMAAYRPYLRAADAAAAQAREVLAGKFVGKPYSAAVVTEPAYLAKAPVPKRICTGPQQS